MEQQSLRKQQEREQRGQEKLSKISPHSKQLSQEVAQQSQQFQRRRNYNVATIINIGKITCIRKGNTPKTLKW
ncbi:unnamed protein product [Rhizophagus irregularis]|nr:unnamed protein product [Rhizophagus irregularis]